MQKGLFNDLDWNELFFIFEIYRKVFQHPTLSIVDFINEHFQMILNFLLALEL